ncbi:NADP-dependent oxidoreductase [Sphingomonas sp. RB3P16]|uniref:NADP-dependent oxidoreductase n=1 Tax=Parasphingomonas frigoris TaxID=3096163 RepID=UPI002FC85D49
MHSESDHSQPNDAPSRTSMLAARVHAFGGPDAVKIEKISIPVASADEILVEVHAAGVGPWDGWIRAGKSALPQPLPLTLGSDVSGIVVDVGRDATSFANGQSVYGVTNTRFTDGNAEFAVCKAAMMARKPELISHIDAASVPVIAATAWQMLFDHAHLVGGQSVLIHGGAGNVGRFAIQFARAAGLRVSTTASAADASELRKLGADIVLDRDFTGAEKVDAAIDLVGGASQDRLIGLVREGGALISAVAAPDAALARSADIRAAFILVDVTTDVLDRFSALFRSGGLQTFVGSVLSLQEAPTAHRMLEGELPRSPGKIVLKVRD